eukprot:3051031-Prymnesium_polylepis.1
MVASSTYARGSRAHTVCVSAARLGARASSAPERTCCRLAVDQDGAAPGANPVLAERPKPPTELGRGQSHALSLHLAHARALFEQLEGVEPRSLHKGRGRGMR